MYGQLIVPQYGLWTPTIGGSGGASGQTYNFQDGQWIKFGKLVTLFGVLQLSAKGTITGQVEIQGIPFPVTSEFTNYRSVCAVNWFSLATSIIIVQGAMIQGDDNITLRINTAAAGSLDTALAEADLNDDTAFSFTMPYLTDN
jgi:hypothetical protein